MNPSSRLQTLTDRCVMCGLCSSHCPTYGLSATENESPRGRIALINAVNQGQLALEPSANRHLEHCVGCRACERFCPSGVQFGEIMDQGLALARATQDDTKGSHPLSQTLFKTLLNTMARPRRLDRAGKWLGRYQRWGVQKIVRASGLLRLMGLQESERLLPAVGKRQGPFREYYPSQGEYRGDVALFTGCITRLVERETLEATLSLLTRLGYGVHVPATQGCCGALHRHSGDPLQAESLAIRNLQAFSRLDVVAIVHTASGCTAQLREYGLHLQHSGEEKAANDFSRKVMDITRFVADIIGRNEWPPMLPIKPLRHTVLLHTPCSLRNVLRDETSARQLLQAIPQIDLQSLPETLGCCGAGGGYMLSQATLSRQLRQKTLSAIDESLRHRPAAILLTSNVGCAMNLAAGLGENGLALPVMHPVSLLHQQLDPR